MVELLHNKLAVHVHTSHIHSSTVDHATQHHYTIFLCNVPTQHPYTTSLHNVPTQYSYAMSLHNVPIQYSYAMSLHNIPTQRPHTTSLCNYAITEIESRYKVKSDNGIHEQHALQPQWPLLQAEKWVHWKSWSELCLQVVLYGCGRHASTEGFLKRWGHDDHSI